MTWNWQRPDWPNFLNAAISNAARDYKAYPVPV